MLLEKIRRLYAPVKKNTPGWIYNPVRSVGTAIIGPILFAYNSGYYLSCFKRKAVSKDGGPLPWYTYPCIDFLRFRPYEGKRVLEFGGGQSTLWWAGRAQSVVTLEGDEDWYEKIKRTVPDNVELHYVSTDSLEENVSQVKEVLESSKHSKYDVIVIDGLYRFAMIEVALSRVKEDGIIICDNSSGYGIYEGFRGAGLRRVDFFGPAPGVVVPHTTSIYFPPKSFIFDPEYQIPELSRIWK